MSFIIVGHTHVEIMVDCWA